jgi:hypothetical protein
LTDYSRYEIEEFAKEMFAKYRGGRKVDKFTTKRSYDPEKDQDEEFFQVGRRFSEMEGGWFDPEEASYARAHMAEQMNRNLDLGEANFVFNRLKEFSDSNKIKTVQMEEFNFESFCNKLLEFGEITHVILPAEYNRKLMDWAWDKGLLKEDGLDYLFPGGVRIMFAHKDVDMDNNIFVVNKEDLTVVRKKRRDKDLDDIEADLGMNLIQDYRDLGEDEELMLYFGESENGKVDFLFRTILRIEEPSSSDSVGAIKLKD